MDVVVDVLQGHVASAERHLTLPPPLGAGKRAPSRVVVRRVHAVKRIRQRTRRSPRVLFAWVVPILVEVAEECIHRLEIVDAFETGKCLSIITGLDAISAETCALGPLLDHLLACEVVYADRVLCSATYRHDGIWIGRVIGDIPLLLSWWHLPKRKRFPLRILLWVVEPPERIRMLDEFLTRELQGNFRDGEYVWKRKFIIIRLSARPVPVWQAPKVFGPFPVLDVIPVRLQVVDDIVHKLPEALLLHRKRALVGRERMQQQVSGYAPHTATCMGGAKSGT